MIRCVRKHKFVDPEGTCPDHSNTKAFEDEFLLKAFLGSLYDQKGKAKK